MELTQVLSTEGRIGPRAFALAVPAIYLAGLAAQALLAPEVTARGGLWPFIAAQVLLIWVWLVVHIRRLRDAGQGPAGAIAVAVVYALAVCLLLMLVAFLTNPNDVALPGEAPRTSSDSALGFFLLVVILGLLFSPDFGVFMSILKLLIFIACLPVLVSAIFSVWTGLRRSVP